MSVALHNYLPRLPESALQEFTEWCILEQAKEAGYEFNPNESKLANLPTAEYIAEFVGQFIESTRNTIEAGLAAVFAGKQADNHALPGIAVVVDFASIYVLYLLPKGEKNEKPADEKINQASKEQFKKLQQIAQTYGVEI
jgi:hypothetical protein